MTRITNNLFVGSLDEAFDDIVKSNVSHMLNVASELNLKRVNHTYHKIGINDDDKDTNIQDYLEPCVMWIQNAIDKEDGVVLVHCLEGKSRSVCVCIAYLCSVLNWTFDEALEAISTKRTIDIYDNYVVQLKDWIEKHT